MAIGRYKIVFLILVLGMCVPITTAGTLYIQNATVANTGETVIVNILLDEALLGVSGYNISVSLLNPPVGASSPPASTALP